MSKIRPTPPKKNNNNKKQLAAHVKAMANADARMSLQEIADCLSASYQDPK